jgi:Putative zinc dependent peptidase (DUF5700)
MRIATAFVAATLLNGALGSDASAEGLELIFDTESAHSVLDVLTGSVAATPEELARVAALPGNQAQIRHHTRFRASFTTASFIEALGKAARGEPLGDDPWDLATARERLIPTRDLLARVEASPHDLSDAIASRLTAFLPPGRTTRVNVHFIVGGGSDGFAPNDTDFYIALQFFRGDEEGLRVLMSHELFHVLRPSKKPAERDAAVVPRKVRNTRGLLDQTMNEGVASWIGDPTLATGGGPYVEWFAKKYRRNLDRLGENVTLFDSLLFRAWNDGDADPNALHLLGFSGVWDSPLYYVGYAMARYLAEKEGPAAVPSAVRAGPEAFFARYRAAALKYGGAPVVFSKSSERIFARLPAPRP